MDDEIRIVTPEELEEDQLSVRPQSLYEYIGQKSVKEMLGVYI